MHTTAPSTPAAPGAAERIRSMLVAASSLTLLADGDRAHLIGRHTVDARGQLALDLPADTTTARAAARAADGDLPIAVELTDIAATAMRNRVRAQVTIHGTLQLLGQRHANTGPAASGLARIRPACAQLIQGATYALVGAADLAAANPDPLARHETAWLTHLTDTHPHIIELLARLIPARQLHGVRRVHPLRLDRLGIVLRLEYLRDDRDVRLPFAHPLHHPRDAAAQIQALLHQAHGCRRQRLHRNGH